MTPDPITPDPSSQTPNGDTALARSVGRRAARRAYWLVHGERSLARNLAMIGALGWLVVTPTLAGLFLGRWLDHRFASGIFWTGALLMVGLALGCQLVWRRIGEIQKEDDA